MKIEEGYCRKQYQIDLLEALRFAVKKQEAGDDTWVEQAKSAIDFFDRGVAVYRRLYGEEKDG